MDKDYEVEQEAIRIAKEAISTERYLNRSYPTHTIEQEQYLNDLDRGDDDCRKGHPHKEGQSRAYDIAYGARYVIEQMQSAGEFPND